MAVALSLSQVWPEGLRFFVGSLVLCGVAVVMMRAHLVSVIRGDSDRYLAERVVWSTGVAALFGVQLASLAIAASLDSPLRYLYLAPVVAQAMLVAALSSPGVGLASLSMSVLLLGISGVLPPGVLATAWLSGAAAAHVVSPMKQRSDLLRALSLLVLAQVVIAASIALIEGASFRGVVESMGWSAVAGVISTSIFWLGVAFLEKMFGIVSDWTLLELCSPEQPVLRDLVLHAPGTWAHSVGVANLAEAAARVTGANPLLCRTMAYYHDIGKTLRPSYFIENQVGPNIHDSLPPELSAQIISSHVKDGLQLASDYKLPHAIADGIEQHHGTTVIAYFYRRAVEEARDPALVREADYRYPGKKPQTKEAAILHLADIVEAASRARRDGTLIEDLIDRLFENSRADGQLDESPITYRDLRQIRDSFVKSLTALRHDRVEYPVPVVEPVEGGDNEPHHRQRTLH